MEGVLTCESAAAYVSALMAEEEGVSESMTRLFPTGTPELTAREITGGNLNYAFQVYPARQGGDDDDGEGETAKRRGPPSVFVKQAPDFIKIFGPEAKLHRERMELEVRYYRELGEVLGAKDTEAFLPELMHVDTARMIFVCEFLGECSLLDEQLRRSATAPGAEVEVPSEAVANALGVFLGRSHARTHCTRVDGDRVTALSEGFANEVLRGIQLEYVFTKAFEGGGGEGEFDEAFMQEVELIKAAYRGEELDNRALCHGDLHPGSIMSTNGNDAADGASSSSSEVKIIDPEFAVFGPPGLDVGSLMSGFVLAAIFHAFNCGRSSPEAASAVRAVRTSAQQIWQAYSAAMAAEGMSDEIVARIGADTLGFTGCEVLRTALGFAGVRGLKFEADEEKEASARAAAIAIGKRLVMARRGSDGGVALLLDEIDRLAA